MYDIFLQLLNKYGCKVSDVAKATNINHVTFTDWKNGRSTPKFDKLQRIAEYFGVSVEYLMTGRAGDQDSSIMTLSDEEQLLLAAFRQLNGAGQAKALDLVKLLSMDPVNKPQKDVTPAALAAAAEGPA